MVDGFLKELTEKFGGATSFLRAPGTGLWQSGGGTEKDSIAVVEVMAEEIDRTQTAVERVTGLKPSLFRPPYGGRWFGLFDVLAERGMRLVQWSDASFDWKKGNRPADIARLHSRR